LPGAKELLKYLTESKVPWAVATSGRMAAARPALEAIGVDPAHVPVITRDQVQHAKPDPDLFIAASNRLGIDVADAVVVGDSVWDLLAARRARALGVGFLSGGYAGKSALERIASTTTRPISCVISTRSACERTLIVEVPKQSGARTATAEDYRGCPNTHRQLTIVNFEGNSREQSVGEIGRGAGMPWPSQPVSERSR
jgi:hypothetical protein